MMAILAGHVHLYRRIFEIPGFLGEPMLMLGHQDILGGDLPEDFAYKNLRELLAARGVNAVTTIDLYDRRADLRYDLNLPVPDAEHERYRTVLDIGTLEHLFDTRQCVENCLRMVKTGGHYLLHTPVRGYSRHGLHTFDPDVMVQALELNGFDVRFLAYSSKAGDELGRPEDAEDVLLWVVAEKTQPLGAFQIPQQGKWERKWARKGDPPASS
jgi:hypothetical protein